MLRPILEEAYALRAHGRYGGRPRRGRLARNLNDFRRLVQTLTQRAVCVEVVTEHLVSTGEELADGCPMLSVVGVFLNSNGR